MSPRTLLHWSLRRELWENRSIYVAPLIVAALALLGFAINVSRLTETMAGLAGLPPAKQVAVIVIPYGLAASVILLTCFLVAVFYCLDALNGERRDRSILFWKSMPVSDTLTVVSKAIVPFVVLPLLGCAIVVATQTVMLLASTAVMVAKGIDPGTLWAALPFFQMPVGMFYGTAVHVLWYAPLFGWLMLVSAWARRAMFLWAFLPFFAAMVVETFAFGTQHVAALLKYRMVGAMGHAFAPDAMKTPITQISQLEPLRFLAAPGLWIGLAFAAAFIVAAIRLRRYREPL